MSYKRKRPGTFKYILSRVGNKFSWRIYFRTRRSDIRGIFQKVRINFWRRLWQMTWPAKVRLLLGKFRMAEYEKYVNFILSRQLSEVRFQETIQIQIKIFEEHIYLFNTRLQCFNLLKKYCEDYTTFASTVNFYCEKFQLNEIIPDMLKCLIFIHGFTSPSEKEVCTRLLNKLEQNQKITLQSLAEECQRISNLRADTAKIEERDILNIHTIKNKAQGKKNKPFFNINPC